MSRRAMLAVAAMGAALVLSCGVAWAAAGDLDPTFGENGVTTTRFDDTYQSEGTAVAVRPGGGFIAAGKTVYDAEGGNRGEFALAAYNPDGTPDESFGGDGRVTTVFPGHTSHEGETGAEALAVQADGKIVAAGTVYGLNGGDFGLARYNPDGSLDPSFGQDGIVTTDIGFGEESTVDGVSSVVLQPDGKIVAAGHARAGGGEYGRLNGSFALARYNPDGSLDASFSRDGKVRVDAAGRFDGVNDLALQPDGKIVAAGYSSKSEQGRFTIFRYATDGTLDGAFSGDGKVATLVGESSGASGVVVRPDGRIVAVGSSTEGVNSGRFALVSYRPNGSLDRSFGGDGKVVTDLGKRASANDAVLQPDGKIAVLGLRYGPQPVYAYVTVARYRGGGALDDSFGGDGTTFTDIKGVEEGVGQEISVPSLALQPDGDLLAAGTAGHCDDRYPDPCYTTHRRFVVLRYDGN